MKTNFIILFILTFLSVSYSRQIQIPVSSENSPTTIELYNIKGQKILTKEFLRYKYKSYISMGQLKSADLAGLVE